MLNFDVNTIVSVKDIMSSPVTTVFENDSVAHVAKLIAERDIGSIVVIDRKGNPVGIITERDIVTRIASKNLLPSEIKANDAMTSPLKTIDINMDIKEAAKLMQQYDIRRLVVIDKNKMVGIISSRDIIAITPALIEIIMEKASITQGLPPVKEMSSASYCDRCGQWSDTLVNKDGRFICEECRIELEAE
ncbi:MAG: CBS domain-containing protein [Candidatus Bathyarchaeota archaeon]